jgi:hypothetical protein
MSTGTEAHRTPPAPGPGLGQDLSLDAAPEARPAPTASALATALRLLAVYALARLLSTVLLAVTYGLTATSSWAQHDGGPGFAGYLSSWDARFYAEISERGYPTELPRNDEGKVVKNAWAFMPLFPAVVKLVAPVVGGSWLVGALVVATLAGAGATLVLHRLMLRRFGARASFWGAVFFTVSPMSFVLQVPYAESLFLLLMFAALLAMTARRWLWFAVFGVLASFAHPGALALSAALGLTWLVRLVRREREPVAEHVRIWAAGLVVTAAGFAWPVVVGGGPAGARGGIASRASATATSPPSRRGGATTSGRTASCRSRRGSGSGRRWAGGSGWSPRRC